MASFSFPQHPDRGVSRRANELGVEISDLVSALPRREAAQVLAQIFGTALQQWGQINELGNGSIGYF